ncbi:flagellar hook-length control protein FliK [Brevundimonas diminuta]|uniref:flagellar hook-length control protein FliK n=1 Tax=Brevundimonas diminuta TaxID=293 RepID=UPI003CFF85FE
MSALTLLSVSAPAVPGGANLDALTGAPADRAVFSDLLLALDADSETDPAPALAKAEPALDAIPVATPIWFAPPAEATGPLSMETGVEADAPSAGSAAPLMQAETAFAAQMAQAPATASTAAADPAPDLPPAPIAATDSEMAPDAAVGDETPSPDAAAPASRTASASDALLAGLTGLRNGAGERLALAREASREPASSAKATDLSPDRSASPRPDAEAVSPVASARPSATPPAPTEMAAAPAAPSSGDADAPPAPQGATEAASSPASGPHRDLGLSQLSRATVETTAQIAAQIIRKLDGRSTRFDMALTPEGLGRVDVSLEIESDGQVTARLAFDNPAAAADLRARADELRRQLLEAGLQLSPDDLEFAERDPASGFGGGAFERQPDRRAFTGAARLAAEADTALPAPGAWASLSLTPDRVDLKV